MATNVGVRDLKLHAPGLVDRAARGERIVITRYGRPRAELGPVAEPMRGDAAPGTRQAAWEVERQAFERLLPRLRRTHRGQHVAVLGGRLVGAEADPEVLYQRIRVKYPERTFYIGRVGGPSPIVDMPGFDIE